MPSRRCARAFEGRKIASRAAGTAIVLMVAEVRSGRRRDYSRRPPTPQDVPFGIRRFMKQM
jgi:hypothetical protein